MNQRNTKRSMDELARQLKIPPIDLSEERLNSLAAAGQRMKEVMEYIEFINKHSISLYIDDGNGPRLMTDKEVQDTLLSFSGVSKADAEIAANYVIRTMSMLQGK